MTLSTLTVGRRNVGPVGVGTEYPFKVQQALIDWEDITAQGTYNIFDLPARSFVTRCWLAIIETFTGASSTILIDESSGSATYITATVGSMTNLSIGSVIKGHIQPLSETGVSILGNAIGHADEYDESDRTIDLTVGTGALTAGRAMLTIEQLTFPASVDA